MLRLFFALLSATLAIQALDPEIIHLRAKRQPCRCVRDAYSQSALTCGCATPMLTPGASLAAAQYQQQLALASQLQYVQPMYSSCGCLPMFFLTNPVYSCQCNGVPHTEPTSSPPVTVTLPGTVATTQTVSTTQAVATTETTPVTAVQNTSPLTVQTTTEPSTTTTASTTQAPATSTITAETTTMQTTSTPVVIPETTTGTTTTMAPQTETTTQIITTTPTAQTTPPCVFPPVGTINSTRPGCFCLDQITQIVQPQCGCACDCRTMLTSIPSGVCSCPQNAQNTVTTAPIGMDTSLDDSSLPLTTTCIIQIGGISHSGSCSCLPQYDNCAPNICCLKPTFRSQKSQTQNALLSPKEDAALDILINALKSLKKDN